MKKYLAILTSFTSLNTVFCEDRKILVCNSSEVEEGNLKEVHIGSQSFLICRVSGKLFCISSKCTHQGASLIRGFLNNYNLVCPMHGAEFDVRTGELVNYPGFGKLLTYNVLEEDGKITLLLQKEQEIVKQNIQNDPRTFVIVGMGAAGLAAAQTLRKEGFGGRIIMVTNEKYFPYDRVLLSKNFFLELNDVEICNASFFENNNIELMFGKTLISINNDSIILSTGEKIHFDNLLLATGASPKIPEEFFQYLPISNFLTLRNLDDYFTLKPKINNSSNICVIGNRFLGLECAANIKKQYPEKNVTFIEYENQALAKVVGPFLYSHIFESHKFNGIKTIFGSKFLKFEVKNEQICNVVLDSEDFKTDLVLMSVGSTIKTPYAPQIIKTNDNSLKVDEFMQTDLKKIFAAGDIAQFYSSFTDSRERIEHWTVAQQQGKNAALNMLDKRIKYVDVPYFWSEQFDYLEMAGFVTGHDARIDESISENQKVSYFFKNNKCIGVAALNCPKLILKFKILLSKGSFPSHSDFLNSKIDYSTILSLITPCKACNLKNESI